MLARIFCRLAVVAVTVMVGSDVNVKAEPVVSFESHDIWLTIDVANHTATLEDVGILHATEGWNLFELAGSVAIDSFLLKDAPVEFSTGSFADTSSLPPEVRVALPGDFDTTGRAQLILFKWQETGSADFRLYYQGEFYQDVGNTRFSNERVGTEISGTILEQGAYLSSGAYFYPVGREELASFKLIASIPEKWESVSDGNRLDSENVGGRKLQTWENPFQSDGVTFFAAPYETGHLQVDSVSVFCYFFPEDTLLMENYLTATADYIRMYDQLIGPYPYKRFTVAENFFPTGYGMPGWTLLGQQVLRLPFIISTSLGHEVLHNWWGNSVFVDYERGNWCEGITVYGADYRYKLMSSTAEARDYRKNILKQYVSYISEENDFALREFTSRTSPGTRTIGYNKSMMVFHMLEELVGSEKFFKAWRAIYSDCLGRKVSWEDWIHAFEESSGGDLSYLIPQWIDRAGAPVLAVEILEETVFSETGQRHVRFRLGEHSGQSYRLQVPVRVAGKDYVLDTAVILDQPAKEFSLVVSDAATTLDIDPDYHVFRRLYPEEVEPVISAILGNPEKQFLTWRRQDGLEAYREFGLNMTGDSIDVEGPLTGMVGGPIIYDGDTLREEPGVGSYGVFLNPPVLPDYLQASVAIHDDSISVAGVPYERSGHTLILTGQDWYGFEKYMVVLTTDYASLPRIGQLIPHYGKYSYLVFAGPRNAGKGQWEPQHSPLKVELAKADMTGD